MARRPLLAVVLLAALAAGCGSKGSQTTGSSPTPQQGNAVLVSAASATRKVGSARITMDITTPSPSGTLTMHGTGAFAFHGHEAGEMNLSVTAAGGASTSIDERIIGTVIYMRSPMLSQEIPGSKPWLEFDLQKIGKKMGINFGALMNTSSTSDPTQSLTYLEAASNSIQNLGTESVGGVTTTHYQAVVDMRKAMRLMVARASGADKAAVRSTYQNLLAQTGITTYPMDVWVDGQGLVRKLHMQMPMPNSGESMDMTMTLSDFGAPVKVSAPPASQVTDLLRLMQKSSSA
jgi:hypothetical protein